MKRTLGIISTVIAIYAVAFTVAWMAATSLANRKTREALRESRETFARISDEMVDCCLWYASVLIFDEIGKTLQPLSVARVQRLAERLHIDELNVVNSNGVTIASNLPSEVGYVFASNPVTAEFLTVLDSSRPIACFGQPYRPSTSSPHRETKYYAVAFPDRSGFLEVGFCLERLKQTYEKIDPDAYLKWRIGRYGHFEAVDLNGDGLCDGEASFPKDIPDEGMMEKYEYPDEGVVYTCTFVYANLVFRAILPSREFHEQRNLLLTVGGISLAIILAFLTYFVVRLSTSSEKLAALHRAAEERTAADLAQARVIQLSSLPRPELFRPSKLDCTLDAVTCPAREVGGDFYGFFELSDGRIVLLVADVSGKGVPAAMFMHVASNRIKMDFLVHDDPAVAVASINDYLCAHNEAEMFVTAWFGVLDPKNGMVEYVNAGHNRPYVVRQDGDVECVDGKGGLVLGMFPGRKYRIHRLQLKPGDRLFLYTDGVTEAMDGCCRTYGDARLRRFLSCRPEDLCAAVRRDIETHVAGVEQSDDLTMLTLSWHGTPPRVERTFPATEDVLGEVVDFLRTAVKFENAKQLARLLNAVDEMTANIVGYSGGDSLTVAVENVPGRCRVTLSDGGSPYDPLLHADPDTHAPLEDRPIGGLGILMTKRLVSSVSYRRENGRNVLELVQKDAATRPAC